MQTSRYDDIYEELELDNAYGIMKVLTIVLQRVVGSGKICKMHIERSQLVVTQFLWTARGRLSSMIA